MHEPVMVRPDTPNTPNLPVRTEWLVLRQFREGDDDALLLLFDSDQASPRRLAGDIRLFTEEADIRRFSQGVPSVQKRPLCSQTCF